MFSFSELVRHLGEFEVEGFSTGANVLSAFYRMAKLNVLSYFGKELSIFFFFQWFIQGTRTMENEMGEG